jgi:2-polyprenyl-3-methyl-5-hydroxy-6-metoxy-1,4-benzoquinol methylase
MKYAQFLAHCRQSVLQIDHQGEDYLNYHAARFYRTYQLCRGLLPSGGSLLSIGAGSAYVEAVLSSELQARVVAVDFPGAIELNRRHYDANRFVSVAADLSLDDLELPIEPCDMVLSAEIVEHIPAPPSLHFRKLLPYLKPNGHFVVSTPNLGSIMHILSLLRMQPILDPPEQTFAPVSFENEGIHRREYVPRELIDSMAACGLEHLGTHFIWYHRQRDTRTRWLQTLIPRFRPAMIIVGRSR